MISGMQPANRRTTNPIGHLVVFAAMAFLVLFNLVLLWSSRASIFGGYNDFRAYYSSALLVRQGRGVQIYNDQVQAETQAPLLDNPSVYPGFSPFNHPAYETLIWIPLTFLPYRTAAISWTIINLVICLGLSLYLPRYLPELPVFPWTLLMLGFGPLIFTLLLGQDSILLLMIYVFAFINLKQDRPYLAGAILALGLFRFHLLIPFVFIFMLFRHWKFVAGFCAGAVVPILLSVYIAGSEGSRDYVNLLLYVNQFSEPQRYVLVASNMPTLHGLFSLLFGASATTERLIPVLTVVCSVGLCVLAYKVWSKCKPTLRIEFAFGLVITILVSFYMYAYDLALLLLAILLMIDPKDFGEMWKLNKPLIVIVILLAAAPLYVLLGLQTAVALMAVPILGLLYLLVVACRGAGSLRVVARVIAEAENHVRGQ
jgi:hypothetical protein